VKSQIFHDIKGKVGEKIFIFTLYLIITQPDCEGGFSAPALTIGRPKRGWK